jgi:hypothetical protein
MDGIWEKVKWLVKLVVHLDHHRGNLDSESRPNEKVSVQQQADAIQTGLGRLRRELVESSPMAESTLSMDRLLERVQHILEDKHDAASPRNLLEALKFELGNLLATCSTYLLTNVSA